LVGPLVRLLPAEAAHTLTVAVLKSGLVPAQPRQDDAILRVNLWGREFPNPVGLAAGFDKNGEVPDAMCGQGFGFVEVGTVTPQPQPGNPRPRLFRLVEDQAAVNRMGFNNQGIEAMAGRLARRRGTGIVGVNLGKNKDTADAPADYVKGVRALGTLADFLVINVSSPNTLGLRALQSRALLEELLGRTHRAVDALPVPPPLLVKIAPDLTDEDLCDIAEVALAGRVDGLVIGNTTITRPSSLRSPNRRETGGLSGPPLFELSTRVLSSVFAHTDGKLPLIGVGGIASGADAYAKIRAGASLVQLYTAMIYQGPTLVGRIKRDLAQFLRKDGFNRLAQAVGADHHRQTA
jgi:dihydroorotate dehydrogenase